MRCIFVLSKTNKAKKMSTFATEFTQVQKALGLSFYSLSEKSYYNADRTAIAEGRLEVLEAPHPANPQMKMWGAFVDGELCVLRANGQTVPLESKDEEYKAKAAKIFGK